MRVKVLFAAAMVAVCLVASSSSAAAQEGASAKSPALVKQLVAAMAARQVEVIAAPDPDEAGRLVGGLIVGDQLMVMSSMHKATDYLQLQIEKKQFRDVYMSLQDGIAGTRLFFHDLGCDGFGNGDNLDIFYEGAKGRTIFDGNWMAQGITELEYAAKARMAEEKYTHALNVLLEAVKKLPIIT